MNKHACILGVLVWIHHHCYHCVIWWQHRVTLSMRIMCDPLLIAHWRETLVFNHSSCKTSVLKGEGHVHHQSAKSSRRIMTKGDRQYIGSVWFSGKAHCSLFAFKFLQEVLLAVNFKPLVMTQMEVVH